MESNQHLNNIMMEMFHSIVALYFITCQTHLKTEYMQLNDGVNKNKYICSNTTDPIKHD